MACVCYSYSPRICYLGWRDLRKAAEGPDVHWKLQSWPSDFRNQASWVLFHVGRHECVQIMRFVGEPMEHADTSCPRHALKILGTREADTLSQSPSS